MTTLLAAILASLISHVNPFVGTDAHGHTFPGAAYPFGMVQLSPDTRPNPGDWDGCSGYHWSDDRIYGFSHTHLSGTGCDDWCDFLFAPVTAYALDTLDREAYSSTFSHANEKASPGFYSVRLDSGISVRLTVGERSGMHEYTFPRGVKPQIIIDLRHRDYLCSGFAAVVPSENGKSTAVKGFRRSSSWNPGQELYFHAIFSSPIAEQKQVDGGLILTFEATRSNTITVSVGLSSVSADAAANNLILDLSSDFEQRLEMTGEQWEAYLGTLPCPSDDPEVLKCYYTALYHTAIHPSIYSDFDGRYRIADRRLWRAEDWNRYTVFSLWDTFRGLHPLLCEISPELTLDFLKSFQAIYLENGKLPVWELSGWETNCMIGYHSAPVIADALARGITGFDVEGMLEALLTSSKREDFGLGSFRRNGLVLSDDEHESVSKTLEYAYDDWCVAQVAKWVMENTSQTAESLDSLQAVYRDYMTSSQYWRNVFDPQTRFMRARQNGRWLTPFDPREVNNHYTEGNAWQYSFFVPHDIAGLMKAMGGPRGLCAKLDSLFSAPQNTTGRTQADLTGMIGQYAHGNEPGHATIYLYSLLGRQDKAAPLIRRVLTELYHDAPAGISGNEDVGQMSAWYILSALGFYQPEPAGGRFYFGSPIVDGARLKVRDGVFEIAVHDNSAENIYIQKVVLNGTEVAKRYLDFEEIAQGGTLDLYMGAEPHAW